MKNTKKISTLIRISSLALATMFIVSGCSKPAPQDSKAGAGTTPTTAAVKTWEPEKSVTLIVPTGAGGAGDLMARTLEKVWSKYCKQSLLVVNKAGAGGIEGSTFVARSKPDGYTLNAGYGSGWDLVSPHTAAPVEYDAFRDLDAVARITKQPVYILVPANSPFKNIKEVVEQAKKDKKPITAAVGTATSSQNIVMKAMGKIAGVEVTTVPHSGGGAAITTLLGGNTTLGGGHSSEIVSQMKDKRLRALAIAATERDKILPDVPTLKEQGIDVAAMGTIKGIAAPKGMPKEITNYYADLFKKITEDKEFNTLMTDMLQPVNYQGPEEFAKTMKAEFDNYGKMAKDNDLLYKKQ
jgi:tripartite-type tricarboxylate transporter receptor subunit TctC